LSLIENSLEKLRRSTGPAKDPGGAAAVPLPTAIRAESVATLEPPRPAHKRIAINSDHLRAAGYLPEQGQERRFADYFHRIKRPLIDRASGAGSTQDARLIMLSSALPGDGKTFITVSLAFSMARERDISVLLVDGDLPKSHITHVFDVQGEPGLLDALKDDRLDVESLVFDTDIPNLEILPAGSPSEGAAELVASARMRDIATRLVTRNPRRLVLFDSPPLLISSEARALVPIPGQIVLVARAGHTPRRAIADAIAQVDRKKLQGLVLNDAYVGAVHGYYDYYGYGQTSQTASKSGAR
jgi:exopolysaccharide/PEP-CTERM locus tyrosine autokinase